MVATLDSQVFDVQDPSITLAQRPLGQSFSTDANCIQGIKMCCLVQPQSGTGISRLQTSFAFNGH